MEISENHINANFNETHTSIGRMASQNKKHITNIYNNILDGKSEKIRYVENKIKDLLGIIESYSPNKVLQRGYTFLKKENNYVKSSKLISEGDELEVFFHDGSIKAIVSTNQGIKKCLQLLLIQIKKQLMKSLNLLHIKKRLLF